MLRLKVKPRICKKHPYVLYCKQITGKWNKLKYYFPVIKTKKCDYFIFVSYLYEYKNELNI